MPQPFHLTTWLRRHPLTMLLLAATVCVDAALGRYPFLLNLVDDRYWWSSIWLGICVSQLSLLAWWITKSPLGWSARFCVVVLGWAALAMIRDPYFVHPILWFAWHTVGLIALSEALRRFYPSLLEFQRSALHFSIKQLFLLTTLVAAGLGAFFSTANSGTERTWLSDFTAQDGQILSGVILGALVPVQFFRQHSSAFVGCATAVIAVSATGISIVFGAYAWDPCVYFEVYEEVIPFNLAQTLVFVTWFTVLRMESQWRERQIGADGA